MKLKDKVKNELKILSTPHIYQRSVQMCCSWCVIGGL